MCLAVASRSLSRRSSEVGTRWCSSRRMDCQRDTLGENALSFSQLFLCLSRANLGKRFGVYWYKMTLKKAFLRTWQRAHPVAWAGPVCDGARTKRNKRLVCHCQRLRRLLRLMLGSLAWPGGILLDLHLERRSVELQAAGALPLVAQLFPAEQPLSVLLERIS